MTPITIENARQAVENATKQIDTFYKKSKGQPVFREFHTIDKNDTSIHTSIHSFIHELGLPPEEGNTKDFFNYYSNAVSVMNKYGIKPESVTFYTDNEGYFVGGMEITPLNNMKVPEYYQQMVQTKGDLISLQKENIRATEKLEEVHSNYTVGLDKETIEVLNKVHAQKLEPFEEIDRMLQTGINKVQAEEMAYKPPKQIKIKR